MALGTFRPISAWRVRVRHGIGNCSHPEGQITPGDVGLWNDVQATPLARIASFLRSQGAVPAIQLAHAGRKTATQRPFQSGGPLDGNDIRERTEMAYPSITL
nr:hypothetical protein [Pseudomonas taiwanensis]